MKTRLLGFAAVCVLGACTYAHPEQSPQLTFSQFAPIVLNAQNVGIEEGYRGVTDSDDISGQFVLAPSEAVKRYAANRFRPGSAPDGVFTIAIDDARMHLRQLDQKNSVLKWAEVGQQDEYHLYLKVRVLLQPSGFNGVQTTTIRMDRTLVMPSSVTLADREMRQTKFLEQLITDLDKRVNDAIDQAPAIRQ